LSEFFLSWCSSNDLKNDLLPKIESVSSGETPFTDIGAEIMGIAYIAPVMTKLLSANQNVPFLEIETVEFKDIAMKWMLFLERQHR
jgi:hypothetical protein